MVELQRREFRLFFFSFVIALFLLTGCSSNKYLQEGQSFLEENEVRIRSQHKVKNKGALKTDLEDLYRQSATRTFFGIPRHWFFYRTADNPDSTWFKSWVHRKIAEPPVIYDSLKTKETASRMQLYIQQRGYWNARVDFHTKSDRRRISVIYTADPKKRWQVESIALISKDTVIQRILDTIVTASVLAPGAPVDIELYEKEKRRITRALQNRGYANLFQNYVSTPAADSSNMRMKLEIEVFNPPDGLRHQAFTIGDITVYPDFSNPEAYSIDTIIDGVRFISAGDHLLVKPDIILRNLYFKSGDRYNRDNYDKSLRQMGKLGAYKFVSIKPRIDSVDVSVLDYDIILTRNKKMSIGGDIEMNYSTLSQVQRSLVGFGVNFNYRDRNIFKGAELFQMNLETGVEINIRSPDSLISSLNVSLQNNLLIPKFIDPIKFYSRLNKIRLGKKGLLGDRVFQWIREGNSRLNIGVQFLSLFNLYNYQSFNVSLGYDAQPDANRRFQLNHIGLDYFNPKTKPAFDTILKENPFLKESFGKQLFTGFLFRDYQYIYNGTPNPSGFSFSVIHSAEISGLEIFALNTLYNSISGKSGKFKVGRQDSIEFSHFIKFEIDSRIYQQLSTSKQLAFRFAMGVAFPYGPFSQQVPFVKQFYVGGPISLRAWQIRELGPGGYEDPNVDPTSSLPFYQTGDIKLEASAEFRFNIGWIFKGALFVDAGNVWTLKKDVTRPDANFSSRFVDQIAIGTGFGLRMDFDYFLIRLDFGYKIRNPFPDEHGRHWLFHNFSNFSFDQFNVNFAIGYPF